MAGTTAQRGYGSRHQQARLTYLERLQPGQPCPQPFPDGTICGRPMYAHQDLHLGHTQDKTGYIGLVHAACNVRAAQLWAQARRRGYTIWAAASRRW